MKKGWRLFSGFLLIRCDIYVCVCLLFIMCAHYCGIVVVFFPILHMLYLDIDILSLACEICVMFMKLSILVVIYSVEQDSNCLFLLEF